MIFKKNHLDSSFKTSWSDPASLDYAKKQLIDTKESTKSFCSFVKENIEDLDDNKLLDLGCGAGGATLYLAEHLGKSIDVLGIDNDPILITLAKTNAKGRVAFKVGEISDLNLDAAFDGVFFIHTLMCLPNFQEPILEILLKVRPKWLAISSLFYPGEISASTVIRENTKNRSVFYNTYSIPEVNRFVSDYGYSVTKVKKFEMPFDLPNLATADELGTYTVLISNSEKAERLQISGPVLMNWYFILIEKS